MCTMWMAQSQSDPSQKFVFVLIISGEIKYIWKITLKYSSHSLENFETY